jgi:hypothetical protein
VGFVGRLVVIGLFALLATACVGQSPTGGDGNSLIAHFFGR